MIVRLHRVLAALATSFLLAACQWAGWLPTSSPGPASGGGDGLTEGEAKYALLAELGALWYCDPDFYPIARDDEQAAAVANWEAVTADRQVFEAILEHLGWSPERDLSDGDRLTVYREWKVLRAITLEASGGSAWRFDLLTLDDPQTQTGHRTVGIIDDRGEIQVELAEPSTGPACPICLSRGTRIDTPGGEVAVERLRPGDMVWTIGSDGRRVAAPLAAVGSTPVSNTHRVVHLVLDDGREAFISPGHPTADGRKVGNLSPGDELDGTRVAAADPVLYAGGATYDLLPAGGNGAYWANGILLGSTLAS